MKMIVADGWACHKHNNVDFKCPHCRCVQAIKTEMEYCFNVKCFKCEKNFIVRRANEQER